MVAVVVLAGPVSAMPLAPPPAVPVETPQGQLALALTDLSVRVAPEDAPFVIYLSRYAVPADPALAKAMGLPFDRATFARAWTFAFNHVSASRSLVPETEVPGSGGSLYRVDIRQVPNWTRAAWALVADRDHTFRETPLGPLPHRETVFGRLVTGHEVNDQTFAAGFIVDTYQLFRDILEGERSPTYYDLLYGRERHPDPDDGKTFLAPAAADPGPEPQPPPPDRVAGQQGIRDNKGRWYPPGTPFVDYHTEVAFQAAHAKWKAAKEAADQAKTAGPPRTGQLIPKRPISVKDANKGVANFPAKLADFERRWGGEVGKDELKTLLFDPSVGGIALAADSDPDKGSIVAVGGDRGVRIIDTRFGWVGVTYDAKKNVAATDPHEQFLRLAQNKYRGDGGEALGSIPNGAQAAFLFNEKEERVEIANTDLARIRVPKVDPRYQDVRTVMGCIACHAPSGGFNTFIEQIEDSLRAGVKFKVRAEDEQLVRDFFLSWKRRVKHWQEPYTLFTQDATAGRDGRPWTGQQAWEAVRSARDWYDRPVTLEVAAYEYGLPAEVLRQRLLGRREADSPIDVRLNQLTVGKAIPRRTWNDEVAGKAALFLDSIRDREEPIKQLLADELIRDAIKRFGYKGGQK